MLNAPITETYPSIDDRDLEQAESHHPGSAAFTANGVRIPSGCSYPPLKLTQTPEYQDTLSQSLHFQVAAMQWNAIVCDFIEARKSVKLAKAHTPEQEELIESMVRSLGAGIGKAAGEREANQREQERVDLELAAMAKPHEDARRNHPDSMTSGLKALDAAFDAKAEQVDKTGCCGGEPTSQGICFGFGQCPRSVEITAAETFANNVVQWAEQASEISGLAAVAARLSVSSSVIDNEVHNV